MEAGGRRQGILWRPPWLLQHPLEGSSRREAWSGHNDRYSNVQTSSFSKPSNWHSNRDHGKSYFGHQAAQGFSQNRFAALNSSENISTDGTKDDEEHLLELIMKDMEIWESSGQWMFSSYSPLKDKSNISGFPAFLPEELRLEYYNCRANNNIQNYITSVQQLVTQWRSRLLELKHMNASTKSVLKSELKKTPVQPPPAFGFGGQNTSAFGTSTFPVNNQSSAQAFSFKAPSELAQVSTGSAPAFGNITNVQNHPVLSANSSSTASHSVGFGNQPAPSATAFSFKSTATSGGFGASGFSGFGKSLLSSSSGATSASVLGTTVAAPTLHSGNTLFGQPANASGNNAALAPTIIPPSSATEKLFTPKTELSMEELKQFEAKKFTLGKIPLKPPPIELLSIQ
ncbi:nucleoporin NUP42 isoform X2 [Hemicordylus capensis]|uniref:nucleoporin NUP42 isoform X2 n=1 Tax=Hemicordylus capensis TaxID=884348 RepID=UPI0023029FE7|nr:nucleoporin NUP42 isoform X2 [Hemicordylus capensis]